MRRGSTARDEVTLADNEPAHPFWRLDPDPVLVPLALIAPAIAMIVTLPLLFVYAAVPAILALAGAIAIGAPALLLAKRLGLRGLPATTALGGLTAAAGVYGSSLLIAVFFRGQVQLNTPDTLLLAVVIGAATGATYATIYDSTDRAPVSVRWRILTIVLLAVMAPWVAMIVRRWR
jgi:hypothetical protein